ncbi:12298_t:CDS:2 [Acaulospora colombiana]|uniref:12298_t:CDS:1 n=1 Tax=Acaulospora colombiana TaxID=27376 RepID=A0ACA9N1J9_9GLOM|nr:12298_t:CDS:2 [Acaulospora colombiana]
MTLNFAQPSPSPVKKPSSGDERNAASSSINGASLKPDFKEDKPIYTVDGELIPPKPAFPDNCCMSVFDVYQEDIQEWNKKVNAIRERLLRMNKPLPPILEQGNKPDGDEMDPGMKAFLELEKKLLAKS